MSQFLPMLQFFENDGDPLAGGFISTYASGASTTPLPVYTDALESSTYSNPIVLDANGQPPSAGGGLYLINDQAYRFVIQDSTGAVLATIDDIKGVGSTIADVTVPATSTFTKIIFDSGLRIYSTAGPGYMSFTSGGSSINYMNISNAATSSGPTISSAGQESNVDISFNAKGDGALTLDVLELPTADGTENQVLKTDASGNLDFVDFDSLVTPSLILPYAKVGFKLTRVSAAFVSIAGGYCTDTTGAEIIQLLSPFTKSLGASWTAGSGNGGRAGSLAADTTYHVFLIKRDSDDAIDAGFDTSLTATNLLTASSFDYYRRIGSVKTQAGNTNLVEWTQFGNRFYFDSPVNQAGNPSASTVTTTLTDVPGGKSFRVGVMYVQIVNESASNRTVSVQPVGASSQVGRSIVLPAQFTFEGQDWSQASALFDVYTNTSAQVDVQTNTLGAGYTSHTQAGACLWYEDEFDTGT